MRIAWGIAGVVFVVGLAALLFLHDGAPKLAEGTFASAGDGNWREGSSASDTPIRTLLLPYRGGQEASFQLSVRNDGKHPVRLVGASVLGSTMMFSPQPARFKPSPADAHAIKAGAEVELPAGHEAAVVVTGRFTGCSRYSPGTETATRTLSVRYREGSDERTLAVPLRNEIRVTAPEKCS
jgi:hypothetical protein